MYQAVPQPQTWVTKSYNNKPYYLVEIPNNDSEYIKIESYFDNYDIIKIERVQNPYQYGRYLLYKYQKNSPKEYIYFMPVTSASHLELALKFNCDYRRLDYPKDLFFHTVSGAIAYDSSYNKLIVLQGLDHFTNHDSGRFPKYVVTFQSY